MDVVLLSRLQFAITIAFHFIFVPLTLGLSIFIAILETQYVRTGEERYKEMARFWGRLFVINFSVGVVTGLVQEFQFGMNWSEYAKFVGDVFGTPLAIETMAAFFLESTFLGLWIFGWDRLSKRLHLASFWLVTFGSYFSAFWILMANSFMQNPVGYLLQEGRIRLENLGAVITNPHLYYQLAHVLAAGMATGAFFILAVAAYGLLSNPKPMFRYAFRFAAVYGAISSIALLVIGDQQGKYLVTVQPMKMSAAEALWETEQPASWSVVALINVKEQKNTFAIRIPYMLSWLDYGNFTAKVTGIKELEAQAVKTYGPGNYIPPVVAIFYAFRVMVGSGMLLILLSLLSIYVGFFRKGEPWPILLKALVPAVVLPYIACTSGWMLAEMGRQPWIVYGLLQTSQAMTPSRTSAEVLFSLIGFGAIFTVLLFTDVYLLTKQVRAAVFTEAEGGQA